MDLWLQDFELSRPFFMANKDFMKTVRTRVLGQFDKTKPSISSFKDFKIVMRQLCIVPTYTSEYKAQQVFKFVLEKHRKPQMDTIMLTTSIYLIFSTSVQPQDIVAQGQRYQANKQDDTQLQAQMREAHMQMISKSKWPQDFFTNPEYTELKGSLRKKKCKYIVDYV